MQDKLNISGFLGKRKPTLSFEIFPPKRDMPCDSVTATALKLAELSPDFISVTYGAGGSSQGNTVEIASSIQDKGGIPALAHLTCVGATRQSIAATVAKMRDHGIRNVLALRGDVPAGMDAATMSEDFHHASDLVPILKEAGFCVGGACYPEGHPESGNRTKDLDNLCRKVEAGCDFLTTQMFFDNDMLYSFLYQAQARGIHLPILAGIMPITNPRQISRTLELSNAYVPRKMLMFIDRFRDSPEALRQAGIAYAVDQIIDLVSNGVQGIHLYTMNKPDIASEIVRAISQILAATRG
jgi:methylenetetrahydrofolate reductase (NADPH)